MSAELDTPQTARKGWKALLLATSGGALGAVLGLTIGRLIKHGVIDASRWSWSDDMAMVLAAVMLVLGLVILAMTLGRAMSRTVDPTGRRAPTPGQRAYFRLQSAVLILAGVMLGAPPLADGILGPVEPALGSAVMGGILAAFLLQTAGNFALWTRSDELVRAMMAESGAICFWTLQAGLFLWAASERLGLAPHASAWDLSTLMMGAYLVISNLVALRRGFGGS
jgi:hypothetical protein